MRGEPKQILKINEQRSPGQTLMTLYQFWWVDLPFQGYHRVLSAFKLGIFLNTSYLKKIMWSPELPDIYIYIYRFDTCITVHASVLCCLLLLQAWIAWEKGDLLGALGKVSWKVSGSWFRQIIVRYINGCWEVGFFFLEGILGLFFLGGLHHQRRTFLFFFDHSFLRVLVRREKIPPVRI